MAEEETSYLFIFVLYFGALAVNVWLLFKDVYAGVVYMALITGMLGAYFFLDISIKDEYEEIRKYIKLPFRTTFAIASFMYLVGFLVPILLKLITSIFITSYSITSFSIPLYSNRLAEFLSQSFSVAEIEGSVMWQVINIMYNAGTMEEILTIFALPLIAVFLVKAFYVGLKIKITETSKNIFLWGGIILSTAVFVGLHTLNSTYNGIAYLWAGIFNLVKLVSIYFFNMLASFWIGYHQSNNLIYKIEQIGLKKVIVEGFGTWFGVAFAIFLGFLIVVVMINWKEIKAYFRGD